MKKILIFCIFVIILIFLEWEFIEVTFYQDKYKFQKANDVSDQGVPLNLQEIAEQPSTGKPSTESAFRKKPKYTRNEISFAVYNYMKNISGFGKASPYFTLLRNAIWSHTYSTSFDIDDIVAKGAHCYPCLICPELWINYENQKWKGYSLPVLTAYDNGRLGNKMGEYATLYALGRLYNATVLLRPDMKNSMKQIFPHMSLPDLPKVENWNDFTRVGRAGPDTVNYNTFELAAAGLFGPKLMLLIGYSFQIPLFHALREEILQEFRFSDAHIEKASVFLRAVAENHKISSPLPKNETLTFVALHARRTDYIQHVARFGGSLPNGTYLRNAMEYYRHKYLHPLFVAASDDQEYIKDLLADEKDVYIVDEKDGANTMAILAACNHSIVTVGTFGFWIAYLTGGEAVYPNGSFTQPYLFSVEYITYSNITFFHAL